MKKASMLVLGMFVLGLALSSQVAQGAEEAGVYTLVIKKVEVHKTNKDNEAWDLDNGAPDLQVIIRTLGKDRQEAKSKTVDNVYSATLNEPTKLKIRQGETLEFEVVDKDFDLDDTIGKIQKKIEKPGMLKLENFGRVILLEVELKSLK